ncbi:bifunctional adenosylcobinamide kinase/adenosylcobinamide-phosphate guanylyltransferase [Mangrovicella endophytica]|uniref:bifunctional adenosylcobinamide kinase/adenosylcobinamide-phosphate guanylyltransferase n=1 Tax=Mangrovicella endophytica TaxID=2066697 RepID=UPI000C9DE91C|nr:bifunctional adenosylcobinamide kinase/adenosylcobinamide-phosphate guanylyltransferase [Mangrovicella endophytica]
MSDPTRRDAAPGLTLVLGGARSGKSAFAEGLVRARGPQPVYIATGRAFDAEMQTRIATHQNRRGPEWRTVEAPIDLAGTIEALGDDTSAILVDCLTLWITNLMLEERDITAACEELLGALADRSAKPSAPPLVLVSNEVGLGIVPDNAMARSFRDHAGALHQRVAAIATNVYFVAAGLPLTLKG